MEHEEQVEHDEQEAQEAEQVVEQPEGETPEASDTAPAADSEDGDVTISFGEPEPEVEQEQASAPTWIKELRKQNRELAKKNRELEAERAKRNEPPAADLGKEPDLTDEDIDYDTAKFKQKWQEWNQRRQAHDAKEAEKLAAAEAQQKAWQKTVENYGTAKAALKVDDFEDAEQEAHAAIGETRTALILSGADKPAELIYALGKSPAKLKELAAITDPVKFVFAVARLETQLKVTNRKAPPPAEKTIKGNSTAVGTADKTLERLEAEAERTGDWSKVFAHKRQQRRAQAEA